MKVILRDDSHYEIFLGSFSKNELSFDKKKLFELFLKKIFQKLDQYYPIDIGGFYTVTVYFDAHYGYVLEIVKEDLDYLYSHEVEMKIQFEKEFPFLYEIEDCFFFPSIIKKGKLYYFQNHFYYQIIKTLSKKEMGYLLEHSKICYKKNQKILHKKNEV